MNPFSISFLSLAPLFLFLRLSSTQVLCASSFIDGCISKAVLAVCHNISDDACICGSSGEAAIGTNVGLCLLTSSCPVNQILSLAAAAGSACSSFEKTHVAASTSSSSGAISAPASTGATPGMVITTSASTPTQAPGTTSSSGATPTPAANSARLAVGAEVGIAVGAVALLGVIVLFILFFRRRRQSRPAQFTAHELHSHDPDLPPYSKAPGQPTVRDIELQEFPEDVLLFRFERRPQDADTGSARSRAISSRSGHPTGEMAGTETTVFDIDRQKVLLHR